MKTVDGQVLCFEDDLKHLGVWISAKKMICVRKSRAQNALTGMQKVWVSKVGLHLALRRSIFVVTVKSALLLGHLLFRRGRP